MICEPPRDQTLRFRALIAEHIGLRFEDKKIDALGAVLDRRLKMLNCDAGSYLNRLESGSVASEWIELARELTVGETYFFRNCEQFRALAEIVIPARLQAGRGGLRFLSAGCSSGEEAYSLAIAAREAIADPSTSIEVRAADLNPQALEKARRARYSAWALRETLPDMQEKWFRRDGNEMALAEHAKEAVTFENANLANDDAPIWHAGGYDVVFCRNVLMYFEPQQMRAAVARIAQALMPGGYLFLGHAETLRGVSDQFDLCHTHETFYYRLKGGDAVREARVLRVAPRTASAPTAIANDTSWFEEIRQASGRIASLLPLAEPVEAPPQQATAAFDAAPILDFLRKEQFAEALSFVRGEASRAADPEVLLLEATLLINSGQLAAAEEAATKLLRLDPNSAGAHYVLALCGEHRGAVEKSTTHHRMAAHLDSEFAMPRLHLGLLARRAGDLVTECLEFTRALALLEREDERRILLFGGGFSREALMALCSSTLRECGARS